MKVKTTNPASRPGSSLNQLSLSDIHDYSKTIYKILPPYSVDDVNHHLASFGFRGKVTKRVRMIAWLHLCSTNGYRVTRFDAIRIGCTCWNTTVSEFKTKEELQVERTEARRKTRFNDSTYGFPNLNILRSKIGLVVTRRWLNESLTSKCYQQYVSRLWVRRVR